MSPASEPAVAAQGVKQRLVFLLERTYFYAQFCSLWGSRNRQGFTFHRQTTWSCPSSLLLLAFQTFPDAQQTLDRSTPKDRCSAADRHLLPSQAFPVLFWSAHHPSLIIPASRTKQQCTGRPLAGQAADQHAGSSHRAECQHKAGNGQEGPGWQHCSSKGASW